ncbi:MFS transporter [Nonomuraea wenchangensis]
MNVMINDIGADLNTTVRGVQGTITLFLLVMAVLMIPASKLTDRWGRKRCFLAGLALYGAGALISAFSPGLGVLVLGNSLLEGVGTALLIPPVYILATMAYDDLPSRARAFGLISGMAGVGAAAGPLIGGFIATAIDWRAAFLFQAAVVAVIVLLSRRLVDPVAPDPGRPFDFAGAVLSATGMFFVVFGILQAGADTRLLVVFLAVGAVLLTWFFLHIRARERAGQEPLLSTGLFRDRTSNLGLVTQNSGSRTGARTTSRWCRSRRRARRSAGPPPCRGPRSAGTCPSVPPTFAMDSGWAKRFTAGSRSVTLDAPGGSGAAGRGRRRIAIMAASWSSRPPV